MSISLSLRRDTAANIATRAGAAGEVIADLTNKRLTLHDGSTLGGYPQAAVSDLVGRNKIIDGNFAINQRGYASGGALASGGYAHDRWRDNANGATKYTFTQGSPDTLITIIAGQLAQIIESAAVEGGAYTLSWVGTANLAVFAMAPGASSYTALTGYGASPMTVPGVVPGSAIAILTAGTNVSLGNVQFEAGTVATRFERRHPAVELMLCQRSTYVFNDVSNTGGVAQTTSSVFCRFLFPVTMRATPTIAALSGGSFSVSDDYLGNYSVTNPTIAFTSTNTQSTRFAVNNFPSGTFVQGRFYASALNDTALFIASAEL